MAWVVDWLDFLFYEAFIKKGDISDWNFVIFNIYLSIYLHLLGFQLKIVFFFATEPLYSSLIRLVGRTSS